MAGSQTKSRQGPKRSRKAPSTKRSRKPSTTKRSRKAPATSGSRNASTPGDYAKEAASEWGKAMRYGGAALAPMPREAVENLKAKALRRWGATDGGRSLTERLNPANSDKGGRVGDAADALLAKLGPPGKLASKASLGSRAVERMLPDDDGAAAEEEPEEQRDQEPEGEVVAEPDEAEDQDEPKDEEDQDEPKDEEERDEPKGAAEDQGEPEGDDAPRGEGEHDPYLEDEPEHAYSDDLDHYHRPPNAYTGVPD